MQQETELALMRSIGEMSAKLDILLESNKSTEGRLVEFEQKINRHTGILALFGSAVLFFKEKIIGILNI
jgi:hypothetical protein